MRNKNKRINVIREIISSNKIASQDELLKLLMAKGFDLTQATLSRDLKAMKVVKAPDANGEYSYRLPSEVVQTEQQRLPYMAGVSVSADFSGNVVVLHTRAGYASSLAYRIDDEADDVIIGTVAGEDTVICIIKEGVTKKQVLESLCSFIPSLIKD
ncbi:MAG: arginine repressor [Paludibacteraceae bacterium]|nr:arginine repressor [Paludibacteraceae bacterium]